MSVDGQVASRCTLHSSLAVKEGAFYCGMVQAATRCLDLSERRSIDDLFPEARVLLSDVNRKSPVALHCRDGSKASFAYELRAPATFCSLDPSRLVAPATASLESDELGMPAATEVPTELWPEYAVDATSSDSLVVSMPVKTNDATLEFYLQRADDGSASVSARLYRHSGDNVGADCESTPAP